MHPGGVPAPLFNASIQIPLIKLNPSLLQNLDQFLPKRFDLMMLLLIRNIRLNSLPGRWAYRERRIPFLPLKL